VVASPGRIAFSISTSGSALSSECQNAASSQITTRYVGPRRRRNEAERASMLTLFVKVRVSAVREATSCDSIGVAANAAAIYSSTSSA
jgi:hypothetical protein